MANIDVKRNNNLILEYKSCLHTLMNIFDSLQNISKEKQSYILSQKWDELTDITMRQEDILQYIDDTQRKIQILSLQEEFKKADKNADIIFKKLQIKEKIQKYQNSENLNVKLLDDVFFTAKQKIKHFTNTHEEDKCYTKDVKKNLWGKRPLILDKYI